MEKERKALILFSLFGMELSWLCAWTNFLTLSLTNRPFPFFQGIGAFVLAAAITFFLKGRGWRVIQIMGLQTVGVLSGLAAVVHGCYAIESPFFSHTWVMNFLSSERSTQDWLILSLVLFLGLRFWIGGTRLARRSRDYFTLCNRFDLGLGAFFLLFLVKFVVLIQGGLSLYDSLSPGLVFPFLIFSLLAIGLTRLQSDAPRDFLPHSQGVSIICGFAVLISVVSVALVLFFLPYLRWAAEMGYIILSAGAKPLVPVLLAVLKFLFGARRSPLLDPPTPKGRAPGLLPGDQESSWWMNLLGTILGWGLGGLLALCLFAAFAVGAFYFLRWLFSRTTATGEKKPLRGMLLLWIRGLWGFLLHLPKKVPRLFQARTTSREFYSGLIAWGRRSGLTHPPSETPAEYSFRLTGTFPALKKEIDSIVTAFHREVYGDVLLDFLQMEPIRVAWRRLRSPLLWPSRMKTWFLRP